MPVYLSHLQNASGRPSTLVRTVRVRRRLSLRSLAARVDMSPAQLSNLETGKTQVTVSQLVRLSTALAVPLTALLPAFGERHYLITRRAEVMEGGGAFTPKIADLRSGVAKYHNIVWPLAEPFCGRRLDAYLASVRTVGSREVALIASEPETFVFVLQGEMEFRAKVGSRIKVERLSAGDALYWQPFVSHSSRAVGREPTQVIVVCYTPGGTPDLATDLAVASGGGLHPLYRERTNDTVVGEVGHRIGYMRRSHGVDRQVLAKVLGISPRQLTAIESGRTGPQLRTLYAVARLFRRPIDYFLPDRFPEAAPYVLLRRTEILAQEPQRRVGPPDCTEYFPLTAQPSGSPMQPFYARIPAAAGENPFQHPGQQFTFVLQGELEFISTGHVRVRERLRAGDALYLDTSYPHRVRAHTKSPYATGGAEIITVVWNPLNQPFTMLEPAKRVAT